MTNQKMPAGKFFLLGFQHVVAMFGATVLVPTLTGLSVSATLLFAGLGTLLFHLLTKRKVPAFLGSSFAFLGGYFAISGLIGDFNANLADGAAAINWMRGPAVCAALRAVQVLWRGEGHALLPADRDRPHHHLHRHHPG